jgi:hypothetical protein
MATVSLLGTVTWTTTAGDKTVVATPNVGDFIVVIAAATGVAPTAITDTNGGASYTQIGSTQTGFSTSGNLNAWARTTPIQVAASTTWTSTQTSSTGGGLAVYAVRGGAKYGANGIRSNGGQSSGTTGTTPAPVLSLGPYTQNAIIAAVCNGATAASMTPRTGYTEDFDNGYSTPGTGFETTHLDSGRATTRARSLNRPLSIPGSPIGVDCPRPTTTTPAPTATHRPTR